MEEVSSLIIHCVYKKCVHMCLCMHTREREIVCVHMCVCVYMSVVHSVSDSSRRGKMGWSDKVSLILSPEIALPNYHTM
jgi:hypothetical protein